MPETSCWRFLNWREEKFLCAAFEFQELIFQISFLGAKLIQFPENGYLEDFIRQRRSKCIRRDFLVSKTVLLYKFRVSTSYRLLFHSRDIYALLSVCFLLVQELLFYWAFKEATVKLSDENCIFKWSIKQHFSTECSLIEEPLRYFQSF